MGKDVFSPYWYRVAQVVPRLRAHIQLHKHTYRGNVWYVLQDHSSGRFHRFSPAAYHLIGLMDGRHTMDEIWAFASKSIEEEALTQAQTIQLLAQLYKADALISNVSADTKELFERQHTMARRQLIQKWRSPLSIKVPLIDPDRFIVATLPFVRWLFTRWGMLLWLLVVGWGAFTAFSHWPELTENLVDRVLAGQNILILLVTFPLVKLFHEFGHAYAARVHGGEIHDMGIMFLVLMPIPYVDATSSSAFTNRWYRALVGASGMLAELFIASIALYIWLSIEPGFLSAVMYNTMIIAGVSTLLFNANPLIKFDGYYVLSDLIEIPNLGTRSTRHLGYLIQKHLFGINDAKSPASAPGESRWFVSYGISSFIYRLFLISFIVFLLADKYFIVGVILAIWAVVMMAVMPIFKQLKFLMTDKKLNGKRGRAYIVSAVSLALIFSLALIPLPLTTIVEGVVWADKESRVRMESNGFVDEVFIKTGDAVSVGDPVLSTTNLDLNSKKKRLAAQLEELQAQYDAVSGSILSVSNRVQVGLVREQIIAAQVQLESVDAQLQQLIVRSPVSGFYIPVNRPESMVGRFISRGDLIGYIAKDTKATVRVLVPQDRIDLVRQNTEIISVRAVDRIDEEISAALTREVPRGSQDLPSAALTYEGGGDIATNPTAAQGNLSAFENWFQFDITIDRLENQIGLGERVYARFQHGTEPLGLQLYRAVRQTFLSRFNV